MRRALLLGSILLTAVFASAVQAKQYQVLHSFGGSDGSYPNGNLQLDKSGNLYGTTQGGGDFAKGTIFKVSAGGDFSVLHSFTGGMDGGDPRVGLVIDPATGDLYGTTVEGGNKRAGVVFRLTATGALKVLHAFSFKTDGENPLATLTRDPQGNLFGTTFQEGQNGGGTVFQIASGRAFQVLHALGGSDGSQPLGRLLQSGSNFYGITTIGGGGSGTIFKVTLDGAFQVLNSPGNGTGLTGGLARDDVGNLYGATVWGENGSIFALNPAGTLGTLYTFTGGADGRFPVGDMLMAKSGTLYGAASRGGTGDNGTVFKLGLNGKLTPLHVFAGSDGATPNGGLVKGKGGMLYGTTLYGGSQNLGVVYRLAPR